MKCGNPKIKNKDKYFTLIEESFMETFIPYDQISHAHHTLTDMQMEEEPSKGDFHKFKSSFELKGA